MKLVYGVEIGKKEGNKTKKNQNFNFSEGCICVCVCTLDHTIRCISYCKYCQNNWKTRVKKVTVLCAVDQEAIQGLTRGEMKTNEW